jgi:hypothetical protein
MPDVEAIRRVARAKLGVMSRGATGEFGMLARLLGPDEPILAMAIAQVRGGGRLFSGRVVVATPHRMLLVGKAMITRRERVREIALASVRGAHATPPGTLELMLDDGVLRLYVAPPPQLSALADAARGYSRPERFSELDALARSKLGRVIGFAVEGSLVALAEELASDEEVIDLALWSGKPGGIVAVCDTRLVAVPDKGFGTGTPTSVPYAEIVEIHCDGADLVVRGGDREHRFTDLAPPDRAGVIATRVNAQIR